MLIFLFSCCFDFLRGKSCEFCNFHEVLEDVTSFCTAKLYVLMGLHVIFSSPKAVFSICLRYEYDFLAIIILLNWIRAIPPLLPKSLQSYRALYH